MQVARKITRILFAPSILAYGWVGLIFPHQCRAHNSSGFAPIGLLPFLGLVYAKSSKWLEHAPDDFFSRPPMHI
jgi:hypothetical protein